MRRPRGVVAFHPVGSACQGNARIGQDNLNASLRPRPPFNQYDRRQSVVILTAGKNLYVPFEATHRIPTFGIISQSNGLRWVLACHRAGRSTPSLYRLFSSDFTRSMQLCISACARSVGASLRKAAS